MNLSDPKIMQLSQQIDRHNLPSQARSFIVAMACAMAFAKALPTFHAKDIPDLETHYGQNLALIAHRWTGELNEIILIDHKTVRPATQKFYSLLHGVSFRAPTFFEATICHNPMGFFFGAGTLISEGDMAIMQAHHEALASICTAVYEVVVSRKDAQFSPTMSL